MASEPVTYTCEGCGAQITTTHEEAFQEGWDTPERFMSHTTCPKCPITCTLWWDMMINKRTQITQEEYTLLLEYNRLYEAANPGSPGPGNSQQEEVLP